jgi:hypothetical protein
MYPNGIIFTKAQLDELKCLSIEKKDDGKFIGLLLLILFGTDGLKSITLTGITRGKNKVEKCAPMDPLKKLFIKGKYFFYFLLTNSKYKSHKTFCFVPELFMQRLQEEKSDEERSARMKKLNRHITQKIENVKKNRNENK